MADTKLYFIALIPPEALREKVRGLKEEMKECFGAGHALKSPAHITLQMPFKREEKEEAQLISDLAAFAQIQHPFSIQLSGFDCFAPRVIYLKPIGYEPITELHDQLSTFLLENMGFQEDEVNARFHPHMTIATRDLRKNAFRMAWAEFEHRPFTGKFVADSFFLLKHNGRHWDIYRQLAFEG